ncbi:MAG: DUF4870 domain-containing protein [Phycisphaerae bacterium]
MTQTPGATPQTPGVTNPPPAPPPGAVPPPEIEQNKEARTMGMLCHLLGILTGFVGPLIIWLIKKDQSPFVSDQGKEALNFQITLVFAYIIGGVTACFFIGIFITLAAWICSIIFSIIGCMKANQGIRYRYPFAIRLIK